MWGMHENFLQLVKGCWSESREGCAMVQISGKLKTFKKNFTKVECGGVW